MTGHGLVSLLAWPGRIGVALLVGLIRIYQYTLRDRKSVV